MNILLAEDDSFFQNFYKSELEAKGYQVKVAKNGVEALTMIKASQPDLLILDIIMPEKDGFEVLEELSSSGLIRKLPVLIFSTLGQEKDLKKAMDLGARGYVNKSFFDLTSLITKIEQIAQ